VPGSVPAFYLQSHMASHRVRCGIFSLCVMSALGKFQIWSMWISDCCTGDVQPTIPNHQTRPLFGDLNAIVIMPNPKLGFPPQPMTSLFCNGEWHCHCPVSQDPRSWSGLLPTLCSFSPCPLSAKPASWMSCVHSCPSPLLCS
jgi:hypothetical protein